MCTFWFMQAETGTDWLAPSVRLWRMRRSQVTVAGLAVALAAGLLAGIADGAGVGAIAAVAAIVAAAATATFLRNKTRSWAYREREDDLIVKRGVLVRRISVVPYGRMQFVEVTAGPVERWFKLSTVQLHTAAAASDARIPGLEQDEAARLRDRLATLGEAKAAGL
jgi:membrane protein YdbS with pleckstrin-like domain